MLFYQRIETAYQVEHSIRAIDRTLGALMNEFGENAKYAAATEYISIRALAWIAPVLSFAENVSPKMTALVGELEERELLTGDQMFHDRENQILDFLGPNIDTGFQLAASRAASNGSRSVRHWPIFCAAPTAPCSTRSSKPGPDSRPKTLRISLRSCSASRRDALIIASCRQG